ncbi:hypothetical protein LLEC1_02735 [Akanthomyces lecanii]|uniref:Protein kinase domain-containing protein n=1 Tax=Cordyceps confragosa TaxID=2714763 RepID=A0A179IE00_CORDF|nr:hypothetical protein LLEC1_02735 [Akanthomyces lecanii]
MADSQINSLVTTPRWSVIDFTFIRAEKCARIVVMCDYTFYVIQLRIYALRSSRLLQERFELFLEVAEKRDVEGYTVKDFYNWAVQPLLPILCEYAEVTPWPRVMVPTLRDFLHAPIMEYKLTAESDTLFLKPQRESEETRFMFGVRRPGIDGSWPRYLPVNLQLDEQDGLCTVPHKVVLPNRTPAFFKLVRAEDAVSLEGALQSYSKIRDVQLREWVHVPRLLGIVVRGDDSDVVLGLLLTFVPCGAASLRLALDKGAPQRWRRRWVAQIRLILSALHENDIVWGGTGPENVIIDTDQNAWLIGFGGGEPGDLPSSRASTMEADLKVLERLIEFTGGSVPYYY